MLEWLSVPHNGGTVLLSIATMQWFVLFIWFSSRAVYDKISTQLPGMGCLLMFWISSVVLRLHVAPELYPHIVKLLN